MSYSMCNEHKFFADLQESFISQDHCITSVFLIWIRSNMNKEKRYGFRTIRIGKYTIKSNYCNNIFKKIV